MVEDYKDEPYILMWVWGMKTSTGGEQLRKRSGGFLCAGRPRRPAHPSAGSHSAGRHRQRDELHFDILKEKAPHIDVIGENVYRGEQGFGRSLFQDVRELFDKPTMVNRVRGAGLCGGLY